MESIDLKRNLYKKLKEFYNDDDFAGGVISNTKSDEDRKVIIEYIDEGKDVTVENIILLSLYLGKKKIDGEKYGYFKKNGGTD